MASVFSVHHTGHLLTLQLLGYRHSRHSSWPISEAKSKASSPLVWGLSNFPQNINVNALNNEKEKLAWLSHVHSKSVALSLGLIEPQGIG